MISISKLWVCSLHTKTQLQQTIHKKIKNKVKTNLTDGATFQTGPLTDKCEIVTSFFVDEVDFYKRHLSTFEGLLLKFSLDRFLLR